MVSLSLAMGVTLGRNHPIKAKAILTKEVGQPPSNSLDRFGWQVQQYLRLSQGEEAAFESIKSGFKAYFRKGAEEGKRSSWICVKVLSPLGLDVLDDSSFMDSIIELPKVFETLFRALQDGIAFGLFAPSQSVINEFFQELKRIYRRDSNDIDIILVMFLEDYEGQYGPIQQSFDNT